MHGNAIGQILMRQHAHIYSQRYPEMRYSIGDIIMIDYPERFYNNNKEVSGKALLYKGSSLGEMEVSNKSLQHRNEFHDDKATILEINGYVSFAKLGTTGSF